MGSSNWLVAFAVALFVVLGIGDGTGWVRFDRPIFGNFHTPGNFVLGRRHGYAGRWVYVE